MGGKYNKIKVDETEKLQVSSGDSEINWKIKSEMIEGYHNNRTHEDNCILAAHLLLSHELIC